MAKDNYILQHKTPVNIYHLSVATVPAAKKNQLRGLMCPD